MTLRPPARICFIASWPEGRALRDGMMQRIRHVDEAFADLDRVYLDIRVKEHSQVLVDRPVPKVTRVRLNAFLHQGTVYRHLKETERVYIHSLLNFVKILPAGKPRGARFIWDIHGVVGEEMLFLGKPLIGWLLLRLEPIAVRLTDGMVHVTRAMQSHYTKKYPFAHSVRHLVYPVATSHVLGNPHAELEARELVRANGWEEKTLFLYSGKAQKWQNTDLMLERFSRLDPSRNHLIVLTGEPEVFGAKVRSRGLTNCTVKSLPPEELAPWYEAAHYGFLLRDDHPLNRVASPTKMMEYLFFGIVPVVKFEGIGDFLNLGYEYLPLDRLAGNLPPRKSVVNRGIGRTLLSANATGLLRNFVEQC